MQKILFVAYQFPPRGGPGVHRSFNFVQNLPKFGYDPIVLTIKEEEIEKGGYTIDTSLLQELDQKIEVVRTNSYEPVELEKKLMKIKLYRLFWIFAYPLFWERSARWPNKVYNQVEEIIKANNIKLVYTSSGPFSSLILGKRIKKRLGIQWVADFRDPFTDAYAWQFPTKFHWHISRRFERRTLKYADSVIVNTPEVKKLFLKRGLAREENISVITNGYS